MSKITNGPEYDKNRMVQYLEELRNLYEGFIEENVDSFREEFLSSVCDTLLEVWFNSRSVLVVCETDNGNTIEEEVPIDNFVHWMLRQNGDPEPEEAT